VHSKAISVLLAMMSEDPVEVRSRCDLAGHWDATDVHWWPPL